MLLIRPTLSAAKKLNVSCSEAGSVQEQPGFLQEWYCNDFRIGRAEFAVFVNPETCLPIVLEAAPWKILMDRFYQRLERDLKQLECWDLFCGVPENTVFARTRDRSTIGVMVDFVKMTQAGTRFKQFGREDTLEMTDRLRGVPVIARSGATPLEMLRARVQAERELPISKEP